MPQGPGRLRRARRYATLVLGRVGRRHARATASVVGRGLAGRAHVYGWDDSKLEGQR